MADTISGFGAGGFDFNQFIGSVGSNLQQWGMQALNRQVNIDADERQPIRAPSVVKDNRTISEKITDFVQNNALIVGVVIVGIIGAVMLFRRK